MENKEFFMQKPEIFHFCPFSRTEDFYVRMIGYHNFHFIAPENFMRQQIYFTIHYVISGSGYLVVGDKKYKIKENDVFFMDNKTLFACYPDDKNPWEYVFYEIGGKKAAEYVNTCGFSVDNPILKCNATQKILFALMPIFKKKDNNENITYFEILSSIFSLFDSVATKQKEISFFSQESFIKEVKEYIQLNYLTPNFSVEQLCQSMHISHSHLCRIFKQYENVSIVKYVNNLKMNYAKTLLLNTSYNVLEIAYMSGYKEYEYFLRLFKKKHGFTPTEYREKQQNKQM